VADSAEFTVGASGVGVAFGVGDSAENAELAMSNVIEINITLNMVWLLIRVTR
jgi:hypothetical protein